MPETTPPAETRDVAGRCPACGGDSLMLADGGHITCRRLDCPDPAAVDDMLTIRPKPIDLTAMGHADAAEIAALKAAVADLKPGGVVTPPAADPVAATIERVEAIVDRLYLQMLGEVRKVEAERDRLADLVASATTYTLSGLPEDHHEVRAFQLTVEYSGDGQWSVYRIGGRLAGPISLDEAMRFARETLPTLTVGGKTTADVQARRPAPAAEGEP